MTKFYGKVGYAEDAVEDSSRPGVWSEPIIERSYFGEVTRTARQLRDDSKINSDLSVSITISVIADAYAINNFIAVRYIWWLGKCFEVTNVTPEEKRLIMTLGGVYHGPTASTESAT